MRGEQPAEARHGRELVKEELSAILEQFKSGKEDLGHVAKLLAYSPGFRQLAFDLVAMMQDALTDTRYTREGATEKKKVPETGKEMSAEDAVRDLEQRLKQTRTIGKAEKKSTISEERLSLMADRFVEWLRRVHDTPEFVEAFDYVNQSASQMEGLELLTVVFKDKDTLTSDERKVYEAAKTSEVVQLGMSAKIFLEHWIGASLDPLLNCLNGMRKALSKDEQARGAFTDLSHWLRSCLKEPEFMAHVDRRKQEFKDHIGAIRSHFMDKYRGEADHLRQETAIVLEKAKRDELSVKLTADLQDLFGHLFKDEAGNLTVKPELWGDLKTIMPLFFRQLRFIQIPELVAHDESVDFKASGIAISVGELAPKRIQAHFYTDLDVPETDITEAVGSEYDLQSLIVVEAGKIYAEARNVYFEFDKRSFPPLSDTGIADLNIHGDDGMSLRLVFGARRVGRVGSEQTVPIGSGFHLLRAKCTIDTLDLRLHETRHSWMYTVLGPLIRRQLKGRIEEEVQKYLMSGEWLESMSKPEALVEALQSATQ